MSIEKLPSGKWRARWPGMPSATFDLKEDAKEHERTLRRAKQTGRGPELMQAGKKTLAEVAAEEMKATLPALSQRARRQHRQLWSAHVDQRVLNVPGKTWRHLIADKPVAQLAARDIEAWKEDRLGAGAGPQAVRKCMAIMQKVVDRAVLAGALTANPVKAVKKPSGEKVADAVVIAPASVEAIRSKLAGTSGSVLVAIIAYAGLRPGEALALRWSSIGTKTIRVTHGQNPDGTLKETKTKRKRNVRLERPLAAIFKAWRADCGNPPDDALVFPRLADPAKPKAIAWTEDDWRNWRRRKFQTAAETCGLTISKPYDLRHSAASLWLHEGVNPVQVAAWLGHSLAMLSDTYAHVIEELDPSDRQPAADMIEAAIKAASARGNSVATDPAQASPSQSSRSGRKRGSRAKAAVPA